MVLAQDTGCGKLMTDRPKITDFHEAKKRVGAQKSAKKPSGPNGGKKWNSPGGGIRWFHYAQLLVFLVLVAWLMKSCNI